MPLSPQIVITPETVTTKNFDITAVAFTSSTATYTATGHTFSVGDIVLVSGIAPDGYNGSFTVTAIATNTFTVSNATNAAVTDGVGNAFWADPTEFEFANYDSAYMTDNNDVNDLIETNPSLAQALADAADALANAATANANATTAVLQAGVAQTTANGKNKVTYSGSGPSGGGANGDIWFQLDGSNNVAAQYLFNGSSWVSSPITSAVIANLDAAKITSGQITGIAYNNGSGTFSVTPAGALFASSANITGVIHATSGTFTGTINAAAGNIGGFTIGASFMYSGNLTLNSDGTITGGNSSTIYYGYANIGGGSAGSERLTVAGNSVFNGEVTVLAAISTSTTAQPNCYITTGGLIRKSSWTSPSSIRYKENIVDIRSVYEVDPKLLLTVPVRGFTYKEGVLASGDDRESQIVPGFIAEELEQIYPIAVQYVDGQIETYNDRYIVPALLALIQDQEKRIATLEGK